MYFCSIFYLFYPFNEVYDINIPENQNKIKWFVGFIHKSITITTHKSIIFEPLIKILI